jgi:endonuclease/exonuclease/phosphatase family metal-dependent hydrolase
MRLATWNCQTGLGPAWKVIEDLEADVITLQECGPDTLQQVEERDGWTGAWQHGRYENRGVAVLAHAPYELDSTEWSDPGMLSALVKGPNPERLRFVGFWAMTPVQADDKDPQQATDLLRKLPDDGMPTVVAGDFNASWKNAHHLRNVEALSERSLVNAYNTFHGIGDDVEPTDPTSYFQWSESRPYHMDFVFVPRLWEIKDVHVGSYADYPGLRLSDHVPVVVTVLAGGTS